MAGNSGRNVAVYYKAQPTLGTPESGSGASVLRINNSTAGFALQKAKIRSNESRNDGMSTRGRHGSRSVQLTYPVDVSLGSIEDLLAGLMRNSWDAGLVIDESDITSITTTANTIVAASGSWISLGIKVGDVVVITNHATAANNNVPVRVISLSATTLTLAGSPLTVDSTPDTAVTITRAPKLVNGTSRQLWTFEEVDQDLDQSAQIPDVRMSSVKLAMGLDAMITAELGLVGIGTVNLLSSGSSPAFTSPTETSTLGLVGVDSLISRGSGALSALTSWDATLDIQCKTQAVIGANQGPDVYEGNMQPITGNFTGIREGQTTMSDFDSEADTTFGTIMRDQAGTGYLSLWLPFGTIDSVTKQLGTDGPELETGSFEFGKLLSGSNVDLSMAVWQSTAVV
jgi:hypothetical protein